MKMNEEELNRLENHYKTLGKRLGQQLLIETPNHHLTSGTNREVVWMELFRSIIPKKYQLAQGVFLIDSYGNISAEIDIAIYDEQYTPYVFNYGNIKFIPIEAVAVAVQCKSAILDKNVENNLNEWVKKIQQLRTEKNAFVRLENKLLDTAKLSNEESFQTSTRPIVILCTMNSLLTDKTNKETEASQRLKYKFDMILHLDKENQFSIKYNDMEKLEEWYEELNHYRPEGSISRVRENIETDQCRPEGDKTGENAESQTNDCSAEKDRKLDDCLVKENDLLSFTFQLNQLLMILNNPMFFPHQSYVGMFNKALELARKKKDVENKKKDKDTFLLAVYDITGIQPYIFSSNRLKENIGGSYIVGKMVKKHFIDVLESMKDKKVIINWEDDDQQKLDIFENKADAQIVYIGGGNALIIFRDQELYHKVNRSFALKVLQKSAALTMATEAVYFEYSGSSPVKETYEEIYGKLMRKLAQTKSQQLKTNLNQKLPIFAQEPFRGNAITYSEKHGSSEIGLSTEQYLKRRAADSKFGEENSAVLFAKEIADMKYKEGENSYIAVVHIDGNGIGEMVKKNLSSEKVKKDINKGICNHRELSKKITKLFEEVFKETVTSFNFNGTAPIRPLILDGDDVTFTCQASLAIPFTNKFLNILKSKSEEIEACAGIAFIHGHFPFDLAYEIAENCCQQAKEEYYRENSGCFTAFQLVRGSYVTTAGEELSYVEKRAYSVEELDELHELIIKLNKKEDGEPSSEGKQWPQSRLIKLYEAFNKDETAVKTVSKEAKSRGYEDIVEKYKENQRMLYDALQLIDFGKEEMTWLNTDSESN